MSENMQSKLSKLYMYLFLSFLAGIILVPLYLTFISSFKTLGDLSSNVIGLPREWIFSNYTDHQTLRVDLGPQKGFILILPWGRKYPK